MPDISQGKKTHVLDMVFAFSTNVWLTLLALYIIKLSLLSASLIFLFKKKTAKKAMMAISKSSKMLMACIMKQYSTCRLKSRKAGIRFLFLTASLLSFYAGYYLTSMIKTEMVVIKPPYTIESYAELIDSGRRPIWLNVHGSQYEFEHGIAGSEQRKIWEIALRMGIKDSLVSPTLQAVLPHAMAIAGLEQVLIIRSLFGSEALHHACAYSQTTGFRRDIYPIYRYDKSATETLRGIVMNDRLASSVKRRINRKVNLIMQSDLLDASFRFFDMSELYSGAERKFRAINLCCANVIFILHPDFKAVTRQHYLSLFVLVAGAISLSLPTFILENRVKACFPVKAKRRHLQTHLQD